MSDHGHPTRARAPRLVAFDLDDTLAPSKAPLPDPVRDALRDLLAVAEVCIISGGQVAQFRTQVVDRLGALPDALAVRLHLMPTCGTQYWRLTSDGLTCVYAEDLSDDEKQRAMHAVEEQAKRLGLWADRTWGPALEDRGSQITFSALGQAAPLEEKKAWDPTGEKKNRLRAAVQDELPDLEVRSGGSTSVDITRKGIDKAYGMRRLAQLTAIPFDGDALPRRPARSGRQRLPGEGARRADPGGDRLGGDGGRHPRPGGRPPLTPPPYAFGTFVRVRRRTNVPKPCTRRVRISWWWWLLRHGRRGARRGPARRLLHRGADAATARDARRAARSPGPCRPEGMRPAWT